MKNKNFVAFILSHGRADRVVTYDSLKKSGYTGRIVIVLDNEDPSAPEYISRFGSENVVIFDKAAIAETFDEGVPGDRRTIVYARNACFDIARNSATATLSSLTMIIPFLSGDSTTVCGISQKTRQYAILMQYLT